MIDSAMHSALRRKSRAWSRGSGSIGGAQHPTTSATHDGPAPTTSNPNAHNGPQHTRPHKPLSLDPQPSDSTFT